MAKPIPTTAAVDFKLSVTNSGKIEERIPKNDQPIINESANAIRYAGI